jgi:lipoprotein-releasing system ATP-binding protein
VAHTETPLLESRQLHRFLGSGETRTHILKGVDFVVSPGEYVSIVGQSGSGKSTLLYLLGGLDRPSTEEGAASRVLIDGHDTSALDETQLALLRNEKVGFVFQFHYLLKEFTAQENIALPMFRAGKLTRKEAMDRAARLLDQFGLASKAKRRANRLSGGEQQRVAIARALANEPAVLLADEPTGNLDRANSENVARIFNDLAAGGQTIVFVTHDGQFARRARRMVTMEDGRIIRDESLQPT